MSSVLPEQHNLTALDAPPAYDFALGSTAASFENPQRHNERKLAKADMHSTVPDLVIRNRVAKSRHIGHPHTPRSESERGEGCVAKLSCVKPVTAVNQNCIGIPNSIGIVPALPMLAGSIPLDPAPFPANDPLPTPANDTGQGEAA